MPHLPRRLRTGAWFSAAALALAACGTATTGAPSSERGEAPAVAAPDDQRPVTVDGLQSCARLPHQRTSQQRAEPRLPPLTLPCLTPGPAVDLSTLGGRPVVINLWASWCGPCRDEMPVLEEAYGTYGATISFVGINTKDATKPAAELLEHLRVTYAQAVDQDGKLLRHLRLPGLPVTILLDANGRIAYQHIGPLTAESLARAIEDSP